MRPQIYVYHTLCCCHNQKNDLVKFLCTYYITAQIAFRDFVNLLTNYTEDLLEVINHKYSPNKSSIMCFNYGKDFESINFNFDLSMCKLQNLVLKSYLKDLKAYLI